MGKVRKKMMGTGERKDAFMKENEGDGEQVD